MAPVKAQNNNWQLNWEWWRLNTDSRFIGINQLKRNKSWKSWPPKETSWKFKWMEAHRSNNSIRNLVIVLIQCFKCREFYGCVYSGTLMFCLLLYAIHTHTLILIEYSIRSLKVKNIEYVLLINKFYFLRMRYQQMKEWE